MLLNIKPISTNKLYRAVGGRSVLSKEARQFKKAMKEELFRYRRDVVEFVRSLPNDQIALEARYVFYVPKKDFFTKQGNISARSIDVDNYAKSLNDSIFEALKSVSPALDDKLIVRMTLEKVPTEHKNFKISCYLGLTV